MKNKIALTLIALGLTLPAIHINAQDDPRPPRGPHGEGRPVPPLVAALDLNHDGVIDDRELQAAPDSLRTLDKNKDGKLTPDELRPVGGPGGPEREQGDRPRGRRNDGGAPNENGGPARPPGPPLVAALDANADGVIDATEIENAATALKALDKNGDGKLTIDELGPKGPRGPRGPGPRGENDGGPRPPRRPEPTGGAEQ